MKELAEVLKKDITLTKQETSLTPLVRGVYNPTERKQILIELKGFMEAKQENISIDTINQWISSFEDMRIPISDATMRIRVAKMSKRYGVQSEFGDLMANDIGKVREDYFSIYKHEQSTYKTYICSVCRDTIRVDSNIEVAGKEHKTCKTETKGVWEDV